MKRICSLADPFDPTELWSRCRGYDGYIVSTKGRVIDLKRTDYFSITYVTLSRASGGYLRCTLRTKDGGKRTAFVHRLVAEAFIPQEEGKPIINHKDERKDNNCVENLEWCDFKYNVNYGGAAERRLASFRATIEKRKASKIVNIS